MSEKMLLVVLISISGSYIDWLIDRTTHRVWHGACGLTRRPLSSATSDQWQLRLDSYSRSYRIRSTERSTAEHLPVPRHWAGVCSPGPILHLHWGVGTVPRLSGQVNDVFFCFSGRVYAEVLRPSSLCRLYGMYCGWTVRPRAKVTIDSLEVVYEKSIGTKMNDLDLCLEVV